MSQLSRRKFNALLASIPTIALLNRTPRVWSQATPMPSTWTNPQIPALPDGPYKPAWDSVSAHVIPDWYKDAKFGISMHWGLYAVPAHGSEWYVQHMYADKATIQWHTDNFGPPDKFGYKDFMPKFTCAKWNPDEWASLFKDAGAKYIMPTVEHHDGFSMWDSDINPYNAKQMGPKRDVIGEMCTAMRKQGLKFGACNHSMEHFDFINPPAGLKTDVNDPGWAAFYNVADRSRADRVAFNQRWLAKNIELIEKYQLDTLWWDNGANGRNLDPLKLHVFAHLYNRGLQWGKEVQMITKGNCSLGGHVEDYERQQRGATTIQAAQFEVHDSPGSRWCYLTNDHYWPSFDLVWRIVENTSKNGNVLFNIGPCPDGTIDPGYKRLFVDTGKWLKVNGQAIYSTRAWKKFGEGPSLNNKPAYTPQDIRFTTKGDTLFAIFMAWPGKEGVITSLPLSAGKIETVEMLGHDAPLQFKQDEKALTVSMPDAKPCDFAYSLKITGSTLT